MWPPAFSPTVVDAAAKRALSLQKSAFFRLLRVEEALVPPGTKLDAAVCQQVKDDIEVSAANTIARHTSALPSSCKRAIAHLQMASLALGAQRVLEQEEDKRGTALISSKLKMRNIVASAVGVVAPLDGSAPYAIPAMWVPNKIAMSLTGALWLEGRRKSMLERMIRNFEADLGAAFIIEPMEPAPSRRLRRCFYHDFFEAEGEPILQSVFSAMHETTWAGVPGFEFAKGDGGQCTFVFKPYHQDHVGSAGAD